MSNTNRSGRAERNCQVRSAAVHRGRAVDVFFFCGAIVDALALTDAERRRVHTPVGLPIGAKTPAEIAVSILAEIVRAIRVEGVAAPARNAVTGHVSREEECHGHG